MVNLTFFAKKGSELCQLCTFFAECTSLGRKPLEKGSYNFLIRGSAEVHPSKSPKNPLTIHLFIFGFGGFQVKIARNTRKLYSQTANFVISFKMTVLAKTPKNTRLISFFKRFLEVLAVFRFLSKVNCCNYVTTKTYLSTTVAELPRFKNGN